MLLANSRSALSSHIGTGPLRSRFDPSKPRSPSDSHRSNHSRMGG
jgi:hypothetical protein